MAGTGEGNVVAGEAEGLRALGRLLARHRDYRLLLGASLVSLVGDWVLRVGLAFLVYDLTGSTLASGALLLSTFLPQPLLASVAGTFADRWDRQRTMVVTNGLQALTLLPLLAVSSAGTVWVVYVVGATQSCLQLFFLPAEQASVPRLVPAAELLRSNAVNAQVRDLARLTGSAAGGVVAAWGGVPAVALLDVGSFVLSAVLLAAVRTSLAPQALDAADPSVRSPGTALRDWSDGLRVMRADPTLRVLLVFAALTTVGEGIMGTLFAPFVHDVLHGGGRDYGLVVGIQSVGGLAGGLLVAAYGTRWSPRTMFGAGAVVFGSIDLALFLHPLLWPRVAPALLFMVLVGIPAAATSAGFMTIFQTATEDSFRGRVFGTIVAVEGAAVLVGIAVASTLGGSIGIVPVIAWQGAGYVLGGVLVLWLTRRQPPPVSGVPGT